MGEEEQKNIESCSNISENSVIEMARNLKNTEKRVDIIKLANLLNIQVYSTDEIETPAFIAYDKDAKVYEIYVNSREQRTRQRFSIAHEIAHFVLHRNKIYEFGVVGRQNEKSLSAQEERQADSLAGELLMPTECIMEYLEQNNIDKNSKISDFFITKISKEFEVSEPVSRIKLRDMGYYVRFA